MNLTWLDLTENNASSEDTGFDEMIEQFMKTACIAFPEGALKQVKESHKAEAAANAGTGDVFVALAKCVAQLTALREIDLERCVTDPGGMRALAEALAPLTSLTYISLSGNDLGVDGAASLAPVITQRQAPLALHVHETALGDRGAAALAAAAKLSGAGVSVRLGCNGIGSVGRHAAQRHMGCDWVTVYSCTRSHLPGPDADPDA